MSPEPGRPLAETATAGPVGSAEAPARLRWSTRPPVPPRTVTRASTVNLPDAREALLRWTEDLDDERAITLWAGLAAVDAPGDREAALLRWVDWAGVTVPLGLKLRDLVDATGTLLAELEAIARTPERVCGGDTTDLIPMMRALQGWMRARELTPGAVLGAARALVLAEESLRARLPRTLPGDGPDERQSFEVIPPSADRERLSSRDLTAPRGEHRTVLGETLRRRIHRARGDEVSELVDLYLRAERPTEMSPWLTDVLDFLLVEGELRGMPPRVVVSLAVRNPTLWTRWIRAVDTPGEALRVARMLGALSAHEDLACTLTPLAATAAGEVLTRLLGHPRFSVWSRAARTLGGLAGSLSGVAGRLEALLAPGAPALHRRRAHAAVANVSILAGEALVTRRSELLAGVHGSAGGLMDTSALAALAVGLPDLAACGNTDWIDTVRGITAAGGPEAWSAVARSLQEIALRRPESRALVEILAHDVTVRAEAWHGSGSDGERVERALALVTRLASPDETVTVSSLVASWALAVGADPAQPSLRTDAEALAAEMDLLVAGAARAAGNDNARTASRGAAVLEEILDLLVDGDLGVIARRHADPVARTAALGMAEGLRGRLLRLTWTGLRRPTPAGFAWRRWLLRAAAALPFANRGMVDDAGAVRTQAMETLERLADDPAVGQGSLRRYVGAAVRELADVVRDDHGARATVVVLTWMVVRGAALAPHGKLRRWLGDGAPPGDLEQLSALLDGRGVGRDTPQDIRALAGLAGGDKTGLGLALSAVARETESLGRKRPEVHWSGLPRLDLAPMAAAVDALQRAREDAVEGLTLGHTAVRATEAHRPGDARSLTERCARIDGILTSTSLKFVDAARRVEIVDRYIAEQSTLCEALATACGPLVGGGVRAALARTVVALRAAAREAVKDRGESVRYIARLRVLGALSSAHEGGMASTYLAEGPAPGKRVVVKLLPWDKLRGASADLARAMFEGEMERLAGIVHPNVVSLVDAGFVDEGAYLALEYIPGASLETLLRFLGALPLATLAPVVRDVLRALVHLHGRGIIHRDIKPGNVLVQPDLAEASTDPREWPACEIIRAVVIDLGVSTEVTGAGVPEAGVTGTPGYIAPELARGLGLITPAIDLYALAVSVFELLMGHNPYLQGHPDIHTILVRHATTAVPWETVPSDVLPRDVAELLAAASQLDPRQRPTAEDFLARWIRLTA